MIRGSDFADFLGHPGHEHRHQDEEEELLHCTEVYDHDFRSQAAEVDGNSGGGRESRASGRPPHDGARCRTARHPTGRTDPANSGGGRESRASRRPPHDGARCRTARHPTGRTDPANSGGGRESRASRRPPHDGARCRTARHPTGRTDRPIAEVDGNRTRRTGIARPTRFEGGGAHQALGHLRMRPYRASRRAAPWGAGRLRRRAGRGRRCPRRGAVVSTSPGPRSGGCARG